MATPIDLLDPPAVMSYGGLVDPSTAEGQTDEAADWVGAIVALLAPSTAVDTTETEPPKPAAHLAHITRRRGTYTARTAR